MIFDILSPGYWLPRYKSESALKYRFGWKGTEMIHYYTEFLGMKDTITEDDLIDSEAKTLLEKELEKQKQQRLLMEEQLKEMQSRMTKMQENLYRDLMQRITQQKAR